MQLLYYIFVTFYFEWLNDYSIIPYYVDSDKII